MRKVARYSPPVNPAGTSKGAVARSARIASAAEALRALRATAPFEVPRGFTGGRYRPTFLTARACRGR